MFSKPDPLLREGHTVSLALLHHEKNPQLGHIVLVNHTSGEFWPTHGLGRLAEDALPWTVNAKLFDFLMAGLIWYASVVVLSNMKVSDAALVLSYFGAPIVLYLMVRWLQRSSRRSALTVQVRAWETAVGRWCLAAGPDFQEGFRRE